MLGGQSPLATQSYSFLVLLLPRRLVYFPEGRNLNLEDACDKLLTDDRLGTLHKLLFLGLSQPLCAVVLLRRELPPRLPSTPASKGLQLRVPSLDFTITPCLNAQRYDISLFFLVG